MRFLAVMLTLPVSLLAQIHVDDDAPNDPGPNNSTISDPLANGTIAHPFDSIQKAISAVSPASTNQIVLEPGHYSGPGNSGLNTNKSFFLIGRRGADETIIDLENSAKFLTTGTSFIQLEGLKIINGLGNSTGAVEHTNMWGELWVFHCIFVGNRATNTGAAGGAMTIRGTLECHNNVFLLNRTAGNGGAIAFPGNSTNLIDHGIVNCTMRENRAEGDGGAIWYEGTSMSFAFRMISDSIVWGNLAIAGPNHQIGEANPGNAAVWNSIVDGGWTGLGGGNLTSDPQFVFVRDFHIGLNSPARNLGGGLLCNNDPWDADNQLRNCGASNTDIGADTYQPVTFTAGSAVSGSTLFIDVAGAPAAQVVTLLVGFQLADPGIQTSFGLLEVADPTPIFLAMPTTNASGSSTLATSLAGLPPGLDFVLQALVGTQLANGTTVQIR